MKVYLIAFLDILICMLVVVLVMVNPEQTDESLQPPGNLLVYTTWASEGGDVDTWMKAPGMKVPVGYSNKDSQLCNLVKDDLGIDQLNYENIFCRQTPNGEYIINLHAYSVTTFPMKVNIQVALNTGGSTKIIFEQEVLLELDGQEMTVIRFKIKDGVVDPKSIHHTPIILRG